MKCKECKYRLVNHRDIGVCYKTSYQLLDSMETHPKCPFLNEKDEATVFNGENIKTFEYKDLNKKVLLMKVVDNKKGLIINGTDVITGITYVLLSQVK